MARERPAWTADAERCHTPRPPSPQPPSQQQPSPSFRSLSAPPSRSLAPLPSPSASRVVVVRSGSNLGKRRRGRRRGVLGRGRTPLHPRPAVGVAAGVVALQARPPSAIVRSASRTSRGPQQPGGDWRGAGDDFAGAGTGLGRSQVRGGARGGRERSPTWSIAPLILHTAPSPTPSLGEVRRAAAGAAVIVRERKRARRQVRTPLPLGPPSRTPPGSASRFFSRPHISTVSVCVHVYTPGHPHRPLYLFLALPRPCRRRVLPATLPPRVTMGTRGRDLCLIPAAIQRRERERKK